MILGVIADDFTGASDIASTIARGLPGEGGLATALFLGLPSGPAPAGVEAGVVALKTRSIPADAAVAQSLAALNWLRAQGCAQIVFKYCSTFDSTPQGNIGPVADALAEALGTAGVVVCPAFPGAGRTVYQGHLFVHDRLLSESGMERHPLNPMTDPDLRRWLAQQCRGSVGHVPLATLRAGGAGAAFAAAAAAGHRLVVADAVEDADLVALGRVLADAPLLTGGSGIAMALGSAAIAAGRATGGAAAMAGVAGPEGILAGSCSTMTRAQIAAHAAAHPVHDIDVDAVIAGHETAERLAAFILARPGQAALVASSADPDRVRALQSRHGTAAVAETLDALFADIARRLVAGGVRRLVVAGGETSGAVVSALGLGMLAIGPEIAPGVPALTTGGADPLALALKSGNFGAEDLFVRALATLAGEG